MTFYPPRPLKFSEVPLIPLNQLNNADTIPLLDASIAANFQLTLGNLRSFVQNNLGTIATQNADSVNITGGTFSGTIAGSPTYTGTHTFPGLAINPNGTIHTRGNGSGSVAGNARGNGAVDLQTLRTAATQVASGTNSFVAGNANTAAGNNSVALNALNTTTTTANAAIATGYQAVSRRSGEQVHASGRIAIDGDAQTSVLLLRGQTTNATLTELLKHSDLGDTRITLQNDSTLFFTITVAARRADADNESAGWMVQGVIDRNTNAASTALVGTVSKTLIARDSAAWDVTVDADSTNGSLRVRVQGEANKTISWVARVELTEVIG